MWQRFAGCVVEVGGADTVDALASAVRLSPQIPFTVSLCPSSQALYASNSSHLPAFGQ